MLKKLLDWWDARKKRSGRYMVSKIRTGSERGRVYHYGIVKRYVLRYEYNVTTEPMAGDSDAESHHEWVIVWSYWNWGWK